MRELLVTRTILWAVSKQYVRRSLLPYNVYYLNPHGRFLHETYTIEKSQIIGTWARLTSSWDPVKLTRSFGREAALVRLVRLRARVTHGGVVVYKAKRGKPKQHERTTVRERPTRMAKPPAEQRRRRRAGQHPATRVLIQDVIGLLH